MNGEPLDELYFTWLCSKVSRVEKKRSSGTSWDLLNQLYTKEFVWLIPNDDNRAEDGKDLRLEFIYDECLMDVDSEWLSLGCSMFELLIVLSRRLAFEGEGGSSEWFWQLIDNVRLGDCNDVISKSQDDIDDILDEVIWRTYKRDGVGGLFPLRRAGEDQRNVELWYQLSAYLLERDY